ncbi:MAG: GIY-YIG nuclease family protein [bacterium]
MDADDNSFVYMMSNAFRTVIYTGVTSNLRRRIYEHQNKLIPGFTQKYRVNRLVYVEVFSSIVDAIRREKQIKAGSRAKKIALIESQNSPWKDLTYLV